jgi:hypothetical protein
MATGGDRKRNGGGADQMGGNEINWEVKARPKPE